MQTITAITDRVMEGLADWQSHPRTPVYAVIFIDAINVKYSRGPGREPARSTSPWASPWTATGHPGPVGRGATGDGEGAKYWMRVCSEIKNRGTRDVLMVVCDGLKGLPDAVNAVWEKTIVQTCIVHLLRNSSSTHRKAPFAAGEDLKPVYTAASESEALDRFATFSAQVGERYPAIIRSVGERCAVITFRSCPFDREIRTVICTTDMRSLID